VISRVIAGSKALLHPEDDWPHVSVVQCPSNRSQLQQLSPHLRRPALRCNSCCLNEPRPNLAQENFDAWLDDRAVHGRSPFDKRSDAPHKREVEQIRSNLVAVIAQSGS
jgi:hypothetical protein